MADDINGAVGAMYANPFYNLKRALVALIKRYFTEVTGFTIMPDNLEPYANFKMLLTESGEAAPNSRVGIQAIGVAGSGDVSHTALLVVKRIEGSMGGGYHEGGRRNSGTKRGESLAQTLMIDAAFSIACKSDSEDMCESLAYHVAVLFIVASDELKRQGITVREPHIGPPELEKSGQSDARYFVQAVTFSVMSNIVISQAPETIPLLLTIIKETIQDNIGGLQ